MKETLPSSKPADHHLLLTGFILLVALSFFVGGIRGIVIALQRSVLQCHRLSTRVECELVSSSLTGTQKTQIASLLSANLETEISSYDLSQSYRIVLIAPDWKQPLMTEFYPDPNIEKTAHQINTFVQNSSEPSLVIQQQGQWYSFVFGGLYAYVGGGSLIFWFRQRRS